MSWIPKIFSILKTSVFNRARSWIFKRKLLRFSGRFRWEPEACFYCPEMCRFSCGVAETWRDNTVTPRGKMSLLHLAERGYPAETIAGSAEQRLWFLEQCTGCGRCTEYCVYENDVGAELRKARAEVFEGLALTDSAAVSGSESVSDFGTRTSDGLRECYGLDGVVLLCEPGRKKWWMSRPRLLERLGTLQIAEVELPHREWAWGKLAPPAVEAIGEAFSRCTRLWVESPEAAWFLASGVKAERGALRAEVRTVWQGLFVEFASQELAPGTSLHESWHLTRLFPRLNYSIPMYERGLLPFHSGWNALDCGGEGYYRLAHPEPARAMGESFLSDLVKDGRKLDRVVCQSLSCVEHLRGLTPAKVTYWLDEVAHE